MDKRIKINSLKNDFKNLIQELNQNVFYIY